MFSIELSGSPMTLNGLERLYCKLLGGQCLQKFNIYCLPAFILEQPQVVSVQPYANCFITFKTLFKVISRHVHLVIYKYTPTFRKRCPLVWNRVCALLNIEISDDLKLAVMTLVLFITLKIIAVKCNLSYFSLIHDHTFFSLSLL